MTHLGPEKNVLTTRAVRDAKSGSSSYIRRQLMSLPDHILKSPVFQKFIQPLREAASKGNPNARACPEITDLEWVQTNIMRIVQDRKSGRDHLQSLFQAGVEISIGLFFKNLRSKRRLSYIAHLLQSLVSLVNEKRSTKDPLKDFEELDGFDVHLGDGSFFEHSSHDDAIRDSKRPVEHFFTKNARTGSLSHLAMARIGGEVVREHDASVLKREEKDALRQGAPKEERFCMSGIVLALALNCGTNSKLRVGFTL